MTRANQNTRGSLASAACILAALLGLVGAHAEGQWASERPPLQPAHAATRLRVVWLVETSDVMELTDPNVERLTALDRQYAALMEHPDTAIAAVSYADSVRSSAFTRDAGALRQALSPAHAAGDRNLQGALARAYSLIDEDARHTPPDVRRHTHYELRLIAASAPPQGSDASLLGWGRSLRDLQHTHGVASVRLDARLTAEALPAAWQDALAVDLNRSRALYGALATLGGGSFAEVSPHDVAW